MKIMGISDIHGDIRQVEKIVKELSGADLVLVAGDITHFGTASDAEEIISLILSANSCVAAVSGNCDNSEVEQYLEEKGISAHRKTIEVSGLKISGFGGSLTTPVTTPNTLPENDFYEYFSKLETRPDILLVHQPPFGTIADKVMGFRHVGSKSIKNFIEIMQPGLCFCGHIHESSGAGYSGSTLVVNPGPLKNGFYSMILKNNDNTFTAEHR